MFPDFSPGPLDFYRKKASFDWKKMRILIETEDIVKFQNEIYEVLRAHPEFQDDCSSKNFHNQRRIAARRALALRDIKQFSIYNVLGDSRRLIASYRALMQICSSSTMKFFVINNLFINVLRSYGTERHSRILQQAEDGEIWGCFCMTEITHGSNTQNLRTIATYDRNTQQFILDTPDFEAAKCWAVGLGQTASHAAVYAQLYLDGVSHGLHIFVVPVRDSKTLLSYRGIIVGDMGEKIGLNGIDTGFLMFDKYRIPRENLLNKNADVTADGKYVTSHKVKNTRRGVILGTLSVGRVAVTNIVESYGTKALTIAIRYAAARRQFGPDGEEEVPILEYQLQQLRLLPYLAVAYVIRVSSAFLVEKTYHFAIEAFWGNNKESLEELGLEIHVVSSTSKPVAGWLFRDAIQECREACGGHGYLKMAGIGNIRNDNDANCTYEGENNVLIQQTSNWLLRLWPEIEKSAKISTPMKSANLLSNSLQILTHRFKANNVDLACKPETIMNAFQWLVCYLLKETKKKVDALTLKQGEFWAKNNVQVYYAKSLSIAFVEHFFLQKMLEVINEATDSSLKDVLLRLFSLYGLWSLEKSLGTLYEGGYLQGSQPSQIIHEAILKLCNDLKDDAVALIDAIAPPDFILNSVLGASDGQVYQRLKSAMVNSPYYMNRPSWWREIVNWKSDLQNKL